MNQSLIRRIYSKYHREGVVGVVRSIRRRCIVRSPRHPIHRALNGLRRNHHVTIVQIGAYIGKTENDPLFKFVRSLSQPTNGRTKLKVVLVEPVSDYFELLRKNYSGCEGISFENVAIAETAGVREFYRLGVEPVKFGFPDWLSQLGSLRADRMTELWDRYEQVPAYKEFYLANRITVPVQCITFDELLSRNSVESIDLLQMDTEGYDFEILKTIDFSKTRPRHINYERVLLGQDEINCRKLLEEAGYTLQDFGQDTFCTFRNI